ncbi:hypothetical protein M8494_17905 [Serratia ureilytica]
MSAPDVAMDQDRSFTAKRVLNNNSARACIQVSIRAIDRPGEREVRAAGRRMASAIRAAPADAAGRARRST